LRNEVGDVRCILWENKKCFLTLDACKRIGGDSNYSIPVCSSSLLTGRVLRFQRAVDRKIFLTMVWSLETDKWWNGTWETYTLNLHLLHS